MQGVNFAEIERDFVRQKLYPGFNWRAYDTYSLFNPLRVPLEGVEKLLGWVIQGLRQRKRGNLAFGQTARLRSVSLATRS